MSRGKVLFADHALALGGAERSLLLTLQYLSRLGWQPTLACAGGPLAAEAMALGVPVHTLNLPRLRRSPRAPLAWLASARALAWLAKEVGAGLLVANTVRAALYAAPATRLAGIPLIWHMRDFFLSEARPRLPLADQLGKRALCLSAARVLANSQATAGHLPCRAKVTVIPNGIETAAYDPSLSGNAFRAQHGIPSDAPLIGTVGRLRPWKGQDRFLRAMAQVLPSVPQARFAVVGGAIFGVPDGYPEHLRRLAGELGIGDRVVFTGHLEDVRPALAAMDLFIHPGDPEPFGLVTVEAMAMARAVLAFAHGALPEIVTAGETGLLVPPGDLTALAQATIELLADRARMAALGQAGRRRAEQHFSAERMAAGVSAALQSALSLP